MIISALDIQTHRHCSNLHLPLKPGIFFPRSLSRLNSEASTFATGTNLLSLSCHKLPLQPLILVLRPHLCAPCCWFPTRLCLLQLIQPIVSTGLAQSILCKHLGLSDFCQRLQKPETVKQLGCLPLTMS